MGREPPLLVEYCVIRYKNKTAPVFEYRAPFQQSKDRCEMLICNRRIGL